MKTSHWLLCCLAVFCIAIAALSQERKPVAARKPRLRLTVSKQTTYFTAPLRQNGAVDYIEALNRHYSKGVTPQNNAVVPLLRAFGGKEIPKKARAEFYRHLGIKPLTDNGVFVSPESTWAGKSTGVARKQAEKRWFEQWDIALKGPWKASDAPLIAKWLKANAKALALIQKASRCPHWYLPCVPFEQQLSLLSVIDVKTSMYGCIRESARMLAMQAYLSLTNDGVESAIKDVLVIHRLAHLVDRDGLVLGSLVAGAVEPIAAALAAELIRSGKMSYKQAINYRKQLESLGPMNGLEATYRVGERCFTLDFTFLIWHNNIEHVADGYVLPAELKKHLHGALADNFDLDTALRTINSIYNRMVEVAKIRHPVKRRAAKRRIKKEHASLVDRSSQVPDAVRTVRPTKASRKIASVWLGGALVCFCSPTFSTLFTVVDVTNTRHDLTRLALALAAYRAEHGKYPEHLTPLVPRYIRGLPEDRFTGKPLKYRLKKKGFLLYSVGENGRDDGGKSDRNLDIVVRG
jgi:hypothetical protein